MTHGCRRAGRGGTHTDTRMQAGAREPVRREEAPSHPRACTWRGCVPASGKEAQRAPCAPTLCTHACVQAAMHTCTINWSCARCGVRGQPLHQPSMLGSGCGTTAVQKLYLQAPHEVLVVAHAHARAPKAPSPASAEPAAAHARSARATAAGAAARRLPGQHLWGSNQSCSARVRRPVSAVRFGRPHSCAVPRCVGSPAGRTRHAHIPRQTLNLNNKDNEAPGVDDERPPAFPNAAHGFGAHAAVPCMHATGTHALARCTPRTSGEYERRLSTSARRSLSTSASSSSRSVFVHCNSWQDA